MPAFFLRLSSAALPEVTCTGRSSCTLPPSAGVLMGQNRLLSLYRHSLLSTPMETCKSPTQQRGHLQPGDAPIPNSHAVLLGARTTPAFPPLPQTLLLLQSAHSSMLWLGMIWEESPCPTPYRPVCSMLSPNCPYCVFACSSCNCHTAGLCGHSCPQNPIPHAQNLVQSI